VNPARFYKLTERNLPETLRKLQAIIPLSIFSNIDLSNVLPAFGIDVNLFTHILSSSSLKNPKPALDGFYKIIELSKLPANEILYAGDDEKKDVFPAKTVGLQTGILWKISEKADYSFQGFAEIVKLVESQ